MATEVLGFTMAPDDGGQPKILLAGEAVPLPDYCDSADAALLVIDYFLDLGCAVAVTADSDGPEEKRWVAHLEGPKMVGHGTAHDFSTAVCACVLSMDRSTEATSDR